MNPEVQSAYAYVDRVRETLDIMHSGAPAWYGWALREAFLAGISYAEDRRK